MLIRTIMLLVCSLSLIGCTESSQPSSKTTPSPTTTPNPVNVATANLIESRPVADCVYELAYVTPDGRKLTAKLTEVDVDMPGTPLGIGQNTHDPLWVISGSYAKQKWLGYKGGDGKLWWTRVHAEWTGGFDTAALKRNSTKIWFEHRGPGECCPSGEEPSDVLPEDKNSDHKLTIGYYDWENNVRGASISEYIRLHTAPCFYREK